MNYSKEIDKFYKDNAVDFYNDDELWKINEEIHVLFSEIKRITDENNEKVKKLYDKVYEYIRLSNKKNFSKAMEIGIYINNKSNKDEE